LTESEFVKSSGADAKRVTGFDTVVPLAKMEAYYIPSKGRIVKVEADLTRR
jgi:pyruvate/2-oxoglutarate/acetoin dehydrogenase E1 component